MASIDPEAEKAVPPRSDSTAGQPHPDPSRPEAAPSEPARSQRSEFGEATTQLPGADEPGGSGTTSSLGAGGGPVVYHRGEAIGRYVVLDLLGWGGMGAVYSAYDPELDRGVAIKLVRTASAQAQKRLVREARALARLSHPNVVQVYDAGIHRDEVFVAMELVDGTSLKEWCRKEPRPGWREVLAAYLEAARGVMAAHDKGLVHRGIKPANILMGKDGRVRVADFGLAAASGPGAGPEEAGDSGSTDALALAAILESAERSRPSSPSWQGRLDDGLTATGAILGTPTFMAPEQHLSAPIGPAADQYSLCASLYEGLYGVLPFVTESRPRGGVELAEQKLLGRIASPPADSPVPAWIHKALVRGLAPKPEERYPSLGELVAALSQDPGARRRSQLRVGALIGSLVLLCVGATVGWVRIARDRDPCGQVQQELGRIWDGAVKARVRQALLATGSSYAASTADHVEAALDRYAGEWLAMRGEVCRAFGQGQRIQGRELLNRRDLCLERRLGELRALTEVLAAGPDPAVLSKASQASASLSPIAYCADDKALTAQVQPPADPTLRARVKALEPRVNRLDALLAAGKAKEGRPEGEALLAEVSDLAYAPMRAQIHYQVGRLREWTGDYDGAHTALREAAFLAAEGHDDVLAGYAWAQLLFVVAVKQQRLDEVRVLMEWGPAVMNRCDDLRARARWLHNEGMALMYLAQYPESGAKHKEALRIREKVLGPEHLEVGQSLNSMALLQWRTGQREAAQATYDRTLLILEKTLGSEHPNVAAVLNNIGSLANEQGRYEEARAQHERALAIREKAFGAEHPEVATSLYNLASALNSLGRYEEALQKYERALALWEKALGPDHPDVAVALTGLGNALRVAGRLEASARSIERALTIWEKAFGANHPRVAEGLTALGRTLVELGRLDPAARALERALALGEKKFGKDYPDLVGALLGLGELGLARHRPAEARAVLERALTLKAPAARSEFQLALAQALWAEGHDRPRAVTLVEEAREQWAHISNQPELARADRWLAGHVLPKTALMRPRP
jgi:serine/threonine protein kinase/tetratricopeptide (TPR) repeat protein